MSRPCYDIKITWLGQNWIKIILYIKHLLFNTPIVEHKYESKKMYTKNSYNLFIVIKYWYTYLKSTKSCDMKKNISFY